MKVIQIFKPIQDRNTKVEDQELVEFITETTDDFKNPGSIATAVSKKVPYWCVRSEMLKTNETYQEWLIRIKEKISKGTYKEKGVEGIYFYDIQSIGPMVDGWDENGEIKISKDKFGMMVRYDYIHKDSLKNDKDN